VSVTASRTSSSAATVAIPVAIPEPRLHTAPGNSSIAARLATTLRGESGRGVMCEFGTRSSPAYAGLYFVS